MNVFEYLGLDANHRPKNKVVQLVKHFNEVPAAKIKYPLIGQPKKDGVFGLVVVDVHKAAVFGRTGEKLSNTDELGAKFINEFMMRGIYIGEVLSHHPCSLEELSGVLNPNRVNELDENQKLIADNLYIALHDMITVTNFIEGKFVTAYQHRYNILVQQTADTAFEHDVIPITTIYDEQQKSKFTEACLAAGEEGACYKQPNEGWLAGHKGYRSMKEVGRVDYDLMCIGIEEGEGKYAGLVANLIFRWKGGTTIKAMPGKGHTHESCRKMFLDPTLAIGRIWRVKGLMNSSKGKVRLPKVEEERHDKVKADY